MKCHVIFHRVMSHRREEPQFMILCPASRVSAWDECNESCRAYYPFEIWNRPLDAGHYKTAIVITLVIICASLAHAQTRLVKARKSVCRTRIYTSCSNVGGTWLEASWRYFGSTKNFHRLRLACRKQWVRCHRTRDVKPCQKPFQQRSTSPTFYAFRWRIQD